MERNRKVTAMLKRKGKKSKKEPTPTRGSEMTMAFSDDEADEAEESTPVPRDATSCVFAGHISFAGTRRAAEKSAGAPKAAVTRWFALSHAGILHSFADDSMTGRSSNYDLTKGGSVSFHSTEIAGHTLTFEDQCLFFGAAVPEKEKAAALTPAQKKMMLMNQADALKKTASSTPRDFGSPGKKPKTRSKRAPSSGSVTPRQPPEGIPPSKEDGPGPKEYATLLEFIQRIQAKGVSVGPMIGADTLEDNPLLDVFEADEVVYTHTFVPDSDDSDDSDSDEEDQDPGPQVAWTRE